MLSEWNEDFEESEEENPSGTSMTMEEEQCIQGVNAAADGDSSDQEVSPDWSKVRGKLFGRQEHQHLIYEAFQRKVSGTSTRELVLITGPSGTGKTALARTLTEHAEFFVHGKFDQLQKPSPYFAIVQAFENFIDIVIEKNEIDNIREAIENALEASEIAQLVHSIPDLGRIVETESIRMAQVTQNRFIFSFCRLVGTLCSKERPLVLFLDDLQWADAGSLEVVEALIRDHSIQEGLIILGCCRGNEVHLDDYLSVMLRSLEADHIQISDIQVENLPREEVNALISEVLPDITIGASKNLGRAIYAYTEGNVFFTIQVLQSLSEDRLLASSNGDLDIKRIEESLISENVTDLLKTKLQRSDPKLQELLKIVACLGAGVEDSLIYHLVEEEIAKSLISIAESKGLVTSNRGNVYFAHDCIQYASLALIPEDERASFHLLLGRQLLASMDLDALENNLFLVTNQLCLGSDRIQDIDERYVVSKLCLRAGIRATKSSAFATASTYLELGIQLLGARHWRDEYRLSLDLYRATAEVASSQGDFDHVDRLVDGIVENARCYHDKVPAYTIQVYALGSRNEYTAAIEKGLEILKHLGETFPKKIRAFNVILGFFKTKRILRNKSDHDILSMPLMQDENKLAAMRILNIISLYTFSSRPMLMPLLAMRSVQLSIQYGACEVFASALVGYGSLVCALGDIETGLRYAQLSLQLFDKLDGKEWLGRVFGTKYAMIDPWKYPLRDSLAPLMTAHRSGLTTGDMEFSMINATLYSAVALFSGRPLYDLLPEMQTMFELMQNRGQEGALSLFCPHLQAVLNFIGDVEDPLVLTGDALEEESAIAEGISNGNMSSLLCIYIFKAMLAVHLNDFVAADKSLEQIRRLDKTSLPTYAKQEFTFLQGMTDLALPQTSKRSRLARKHLKMLKKYEQLGPANMQHKRLLIEAEMVAKTGDLGMAAEKYEQAIAKGAAEGFLHDSAYACERAGYGMLRSTKSCSYYFERATDTYSKWGSFLKADATKALVSEKGNGCTSSWTAVEDGSTGL